MITPCATCKLSGRCADEDITCREAVFCWIAGLPLGCVDYVPNYYHGVEGVFEAGVDLVGGGDVLPGRRDRRVCDMPVRGGWAK